MRLLEFDFLGSTKVIGLVEDVEDSPKEGVDYWTKLSSIPNLEKGLSRLGKKVMDKESFEMALKFNVIHEL